MENDDYYDLVFYIPFNITEVIRRQQMSDNERLCAMKHHKTMKMNSASSRIQTTGLVISSLGPVVQS